MAELADALDSKSSSRMGVKVRVLSPLLIIKGFFCRSQQGNLFLFVGSHAEAIWDVQPCCVACGPNDRLQVGSVLAEKSLMTQRTSKPEPWPIYLLGLLNPVLVIVTNLIGGFWVVSGVFFMLGIGPILDLCLGKDSQPKPPRKSGLAFEILLYIYAVVPALAIATLLFRSAMDGPAWTTWVAALSTGLCSGATGIIVGHELGHKKPGSVAWWLGRFNLLLVMYLHFTTEHNHTHHKHVSTRLDPASAQDGETIWWFVARTIPGQFRDAVSIQSRKGKNGLSNPIYRGLVIQLAFLLGLYLALGIWPVGAFLLQAAFAVFLLEYINYIRHYGLQRAPNERQTEYHSWQAEQRWSRWTLLELTRHPAHHLKASDPFWKLQPYANAPNLPSGYYGCFWISLIPPLWNHLIQARMPQKTNLQSVTHGSRNLDGNQDYE